MDMKKDYSKLHERYTDVRSLDITLINVIIKGDVLALNVSAKRLLIPGGFDLINGNFRFVAVQNAYG